jgi:Uma2 family endonuclease
MSAAPTFRLVSVDEYLAGEVTSPVKHEYLGGVVYAMAGGRNLHNLIAGNVFASLHARLRGSDCQPCNSDTKIRIHVPTQIRFYYPDASVVCRSNPPTDAFQDEPVVVVEVLSRKTRRVDEGEKREAYETIPSLMAYLLVEQETAAVVVLRRGRNGFDRELYRGAGAVIPLPELGIELPLAEVYERADFAPEVDDD